MCIPPQNKDVQFYFKELLNMNKSLGLNDLSMGMSSDYLDAIKYGATFVRIGQKFLAIDLNNFNLCFFINQF